jgi:hypothetical protein
MFQLVVISWEFATRSGIEVNYRKPVIDVLGRAEGGKDSVHLAA